MSVFDAIGYVFITVIFGFILGYIVGKNAPKEMTHIFPTKTNTLNPFVCPRTPMPTDTSDGRPLNVIDRFKDGEVSG